jgi:hypothetical protein
MWLDLYRSLTHPWRLRVKACTVQTTGGRVKRSAGEAGSRSAVCVVLGARGGATESWPAIVDVLRAKSCVLCAKRSRYSRSLASMMCIVLYSSRDDSTAEDAKILPS